MEKSYEQKGALHGHSQPIGFQSDAITLDIPMEGITCTGWTILPRFPPVVSYKPHICCVCCTPVFLQCKIFKKEVNSFEPGKMIPSCQICAEFLGREMRSFNCLVSVKGATKPRDSFLMKPPAAIFSGATKGAQML